MMEDPIASLLLQHPMANPCWQIRRSMAAASGGGAAVCNLLQLGHCLKFILYMGLLVIFSFAQVNAEEKGQPKVTFF